MSSSFESDVTNYHSLFDADWYLEQNPDVAQAGVDPFEHYMTHGWREGRDPHPLFDTSFYLESNPDVAAAGENPLVHYELFGWRERRNPHAEFDTSWYLDRHPDVALAEENPLIHYIEFGEKEGREKSPGRSDIPQCHLHYSTFVPRLQATSLGHRDAKVIAFYLPQFHPIPENDQWWGSGFTEWTNVKPAKPLFAGHYQPHIPIDLGYYDLRDKVAQQQQIELAKLYGIEGFCFCFYFYWFGGKRLLETPIENWLNDKSLDLPFCLCWANENWSRRWDGLDSEVLIAQNHSDEDDIAFIREIARYMVDPRYIRINRRPLLLVYRPNLLPAPRETVARWRAWCRMNGIGEIYLAYVQSFERTDPTVYDFDAAVEFPPNNFQPPKLNSLLIPLHEDFAATVYDWRAYVEASEKYSPREYPLFRSVCPGWDNTARRKNRATIFINNTPQLYQRWLENAIRDTVENVENSDERLVFVNAWNEWAEGAHLEPDEKTGYSYLQATRDALASGTGTFPGRPRALVVAHDAHPHGAQFLSLSLAQSLRDEFGYQVDLISLGDGPLLERFSEVATLHRVDAPNSSAVANLVERLRREGADFAIVNTTVSGSIIPALKRAGVRVVSLVHEMPGILSAYSLENAARNVADRSDIVVFAADPVRAGFESFVGKKLPNARISPQGLYLRNPYRLKSARATIRAQVREELGLPPEARVILAVGYADHRKGVDLFIATVTRIAALDPYVVGVWVGHRDEAFFGQRWQESRQDWKGASVLRV
ncbi:MAG TPA: glycoside hydrolase family 99-like domain-containing protein [Xanthobacteraceae bacterium]|nr:glycoside hydrolase family 99-like domain-containing protein [Xanthobacteraceae bacterium]